MNTEIPKLLYSLGGKVITNSHDWETMRRPEIVNLFSEYVYGFRPVECPEEIHFEEIELIEHDDENVTEKHINICFDGYSFPIKLFLPKTRSEKLPCFVYVLHEYQENNFNLNENIDQPPIPIPLIASRGYAIAIMPTRGIYADFDHNADYKDGIFTLYSPQREKRKPNDWATISAWAYGASRVMDYLETDNDIDEARICVIGHSRSGKTALWCGATDPRFNMVVSNSSGCAGAAMHRGKNPKGEHIKNINRTDWFCENYSSYNDNDDYLPVDQHMLLALIAPRPVYVQSSSEDLWADPECELHSCQLAGEVYELYGKKGLVLSGTPANDTPYQEGYIAYHRRTGSHKITAFDWEQYMNYADKMLK